VSAWLGIDGALGAFSAAVVRDDGSAPVVASGEGKDALERGLHVIDEVLAGAPLGSLDGIAVGIGPGSFTGLRIALGFAKSLAFAASLPLAGVSSYDVVETEMGTEAAPPDRLAIVHGRAGIACARLTLAGEPTHTVCGEYAAIAERLTAHARGRTIYVCAGAPAGAVSALAEHGMTVQVSTAFPSVPAAAIAMLALAGRARAGSPHVLRADYGEEAYYERGGATKAT
jgi:tRNA threonylcarbamoyladenosine biosynthesis protein TsaB